MKILVGYHSTNEETRRVRILQQKPDGRFLVCHFTVMDRAFGRGKYLAEDKPYLSSNIVDIHEEEVVLDGIKRDWRTL